MAAEKQIKEVLKLSDCVNDKCPWSNKQVPSNSLTIYKNNVVGFCCPECRDDFDKLVNQNKFDDNKYIQAIDLFNQKINDKNNDKDKEKLENKEILNKI